MFQTGFRNTQLYLNRVFLIRMLENLFETGFANTTEHCTFEASCEQDVKHEQVNPNSEISSD